MALYEIEIAREECSELGGHYSSTIVEGPDVPAGEVPAPVDRHARLLRDVAGRGAVYRIGYHEPVLLGNAGVERIGYTLWLTG